MRVKFLKDAKYPQSNPADSREYKAGETYDLTNDHAGRWIRRGVAVEVLPEAKAEPVAQPEEPVKAEAEVVETKPKAKHGK